MGRPFIVSGISHASIFWRTPAKITIATRKPIPEPKAFYQGLQIPEGRICGALFQHQHGNAEHGAVGGDQRQINTQGV